MFPNVRTACARTTNPACHFADANELQLHIPITLNSPTVSQQGGYQVAKSYVEDLGVGTRWADLPDAGQLR
jgi:hypothetical protein